MHTALICVLIAGLMPYVWTTAAKIIGPRYNNREVRLWQADLTGRAQRAHAAHLNSFEAFPLFAVAVLVAHLGNGNPSRVNALALAFIGLRALYGVAYISDWPRARSALWLGAMVCTITIFASGL